jgi:hypothetical protein
VRLRMIEELIDEERDDARRASLETTTKAVLS